MMCALPHSVVYDAVGHPLISIVHKAILSIRVLNHSWCVTDKDAPIRACPYRPGVLLITYKLGGRTDCDPLLEYMHSLHTFPLV